MDSIMPTREKLHAYIFTRSGLLTTVVVYHCLFTDDKKNSCIFPPLH